MMNPAKFAAELDALTDYIGSRGLNPMLAVGILLNLSGEIIFESHKSGGLSDKDVATVLNYADRIVRAKAQGIDSPRLN